VDEPYARQIICSLDKCRKVINGGKPYCTRHFVTRMPYVIELTGSVEYSEYLEQFNLPPGPPDPNWYAK